jgi:hypothetical protein
MMSIAVKADTENMNASRAELETKAPKYPNQLRPITLEEHTLEGATSLA